MLDQTSFTNLIEALPSEPHKKMTDRYSFIDTKQVVSNMRDMGYEVAGFRQPAFRTNDGPFGVHEVDFRHPEQLKGRHGQAPRIVFMNSYNGVLSARLLSGIIRFACSNGLVLGDKIESERFIHVGNYEDQLLEHLKTAHDRLDELFARTDRFETITLDPSQYHEMAEQALDLRFPNEGGLVIDPQVALMPRREADLKQDLWTTWNRLQENLMRGGIPGEDTNGNVRETREITSLDTSNRLNRELWDLLETTAELA